MRSLVLVRGGLLTLALTSAAVTANAVCRILRTLSPLDAGPQQARSERVRSRCVEARRQSRPPASPRVQRKMPRPFKHSSTISSSAGSTRRCRGSSSSMARRPCPKQSAEPSELPRRSSAVRSTRPATLWSDCPNRCTLRFDVCCDKPGICRASWRVSRGENSPSRCPARSVTRLQRQAILSTGTPITSGHFRELEPRIVMRLDEESRSGGLVDSKRPSLPICPAERISRSDAKGIIVGVHDRQP